ncbi:tetraacyldisaccharide 4'-kinase [Roseivivax marinus]|jgi:tetraacyldisaccharide 4'-kinase|uniref:tetraacyldisaccharide 4'-kinase n=1 Tax=Roseivivax marinus TaxID=1379903 RepID=UPI001F041F9F|nr:tetraacyldisaccharide 4'-kinase [Roseivivax marinus]UMA64197.1 tetraacyldisaccharide 4'-kinase [Roseivivax marinus]
MRPFRFWDRPANAPGLRARALQPLGALTALATARRVTRPPSARPNVPVICIGNLHAGGTGKTPTTIALIERLTARGVTPHVVSRGYGGQLAGPVRVDPQAHDAAAVGDEPLLLSAFAPVWVARDRAAGARAAETAGAQAILLDDGFQNPGVAKDLSLVVVDAARGFGNGRCLPAGPLREPVDTGLSRADLVVAIGDGIAQEAFRKDWGDQVPCPIVSAHVEALQTGMPWEGLRAFAFAGIGRPEKAFATLRDLGADVVHAEALDDHQPLTTALLTRLERDAQMMNAQLVTTEKDAVRLPEAFRRKVLTVPVRLRFDAPGPLDAALDALWPARD